MDKLKVAILYGADAVYLAGTSFGLRTACANFDREQMREAVAYCHVRGVRCYVTVNIYPRNHDMEAIPDYLRFLAEIGVDAVLVSDPGVFAAALPWKDQMEIHISTQANNVNYASAAFWHKMGASRVVLARELSLEEITVIRAQTPSDLELEAFVHGAMCISYSGRCLLSNYMAGRDANHGDCAQPCRWKYFLREETRVGDSFEIQEDDGGSYLMNSKDLCMIRLIPELARAGVASFKIEGRVKTEYYLATVVSAYRRAIDAYEALGDGYVFDEAWQEELLKVSHRDYCQGFALGDPGSNQRYETSGYIRDYDMAAYVEGYDREHKLLICRQRNKFFAGDRLELLMPKRPFEVLEAVQIYNENMEMLESAPHADMRLFIPYDRPVPDHSILRKEKKPL